MVEMQVDSFMCRCVNICNFMQVKNKKNYKFNVLDNQINVIEGEVPAGSRGCVK